MPRLRVGELELYYESEGAGDPVLLLMGLGGDHHGWALQSGPFAKRHRVVLIDNRDAGASDEARAPYALGDMASDAIAVMDHLGIERFHVVGASMGGAVAQHLALLAASRVASLVLVSTWGRTDAFLRTVLGGWRLLVEKLTPTEFFAVQAPWAFTPRFLQEPPAEVLAIQAAYAERGPIKSVAAYQRQVDACLAHDTLELLPMLTTPTLLLVGEDDILTPARYARAIAASLFGSEIMVVPATGHACFLETAKPVTERVLRFLAKHPLAS